MVLTSNSSLTEEQTENERVAPVSRAATYVVVAVTALAYLLTGYFVVLRLSLPSDGARLQAGDKVWAIDGAWVTPYAATPTGLQAGDRVIAINGVPINSLASNVLRFDAPRFPNWTVGETFSYSVVRKGSDHFINVPVTLERYRLWMLLRDAWGPMLALPIATAIGVLVLLRRPDDRAARAMVLWTVGICGLLVYSVGLQVADISDARLYWLFVLITLSGFLLFTIAPVRFALEFVQSMSLLHRLDRQLPIVFATYALPFAFALLWIVLARILAATWTDWFWRILTGAGAVAGIYELIFLLILGWGYFSATSDIVRQRLQWVLYGGGIVAIAVGALVALPSVLWRVWLVDPNLMALIALIFPMTIAIAILRYGLLDIDVLIHRTLVYGLMGGAFALIYAIFVLLVGIAIFNYDTLGALIGSRSEPDVQLASDIAIVLTTLIALFSTNKLRTVVQDFVDRVFFRRRYNAAQAIARFSGLARREVDLDTLSQDLLSLVQATVQPDHLGLWVRLRAHDKEQP